MESDVNNFKRIKKKKNKKLRSLKIRLCQTTVKIIKKIIFIWLKKFKNNLKIKIIMCSFQKFNSHQVVETHLMTGKDKGQIIKHLRMQLKRVMTIR